MDETYQKKPTSKYQINRIKHGHTCENYICLYKDDAFEFKKINSGPCYVLALEILSETIKFLNNFILFSIFQKIKNCPGFLF